MTEEVLPPAALAREAMARLDLLGRVSEEEGRLTRSYGSRALAEANALVGAWMAESGLGVRRDNVGNLLGRYESTPPGGRTLLVGSHLDTVRDAGRYDGALGVVVGLAAVRRLSLGGRRLPYAVEVVGFADEEGLRFGAPYLGSTALAGTFDPADLQRRDRGGVTLAEAIAASGGDPAAVAADRWSGGRPIGYVEVHIEQGPVLEAKGLALGVVSAIAGQSRWTVELQGEAGHAGTVPMAMRRDALAAAAEVVLAVEAEAHATEGLVATVGELEVLGAAANVVPGAVRLSLDVRHPLDSERRAAVDRVLGAAAAAGAARGVAVRSEPRRETPSTGCDPYLSGLLAAAVEAGGLPVERLASGAGHDAVPMAGIAPVAMLFVRCAGGVSHSPAESVATEDVAAAIEALTAFLDRLAAEAG